MDYRRTPEHRYPAPHDDAVAAHRWLFEKEGLAAGSVAWRATRPAVALAVATALRARAEGWPEPAALALMSAWLNLAGTGATMASNVERDMLFGGPTPMDPAGLVAMFLAPDPGAARGTPRPACAADRSAGQSLYADLTGLSPTYLQVGDAERVLDDSRRFAEHATAREPGRLRKWARQLDIGLDAALAQFVSVDLVEADRATGRLLGAYPFSAIRRGHKVQLAGGPTVEAYGVIDALGIPAMLNRDVLISSRDPDTGEPISITVTNGQASWRPDDTVVVLGTDRGCGVSACSRCPYITCHSSPASAAAHLQAAHLAGEILTQPQALAAGALLFGDLLRLVVAESAAGTSESGGAATYGQVAGTRKATNAATVAAGGIYLDT